MEGNEEQEKIPIDQRTFLAALERVGKKGEGTYPLFMVSWTLMYAWIGLKP